MHSNFCKFVFRDTVTLDFVESVVSLAILKAERVFGPIRTRLYASYTVAPAPPRCVIDTSTHIGRFVAESFVALVLRLAGDQDFDVVRLAKWEP